MAWIGPYVILGELGHGASGSVLRVRGAEGEVALKLLKSATKDALARFERERRLHASLGVEQGFVPLLGVGESPAGPYIIMPLVEGGTLRERLAKGPLDLDTALAVGTQLARAIGRAHALGIIHRDLKPENVLFDRAGRPLIADLGLAKHFRPSLSGEKSLSLTKAGMAVGTPGYMPFEQLASAKEVGPTADVFALGAILYECLAGTPPFVAANVVELAGQLESGTYAPLRRLCPEAPPWVASVVERALAKAPRDRYEDARALAAALSRGPGRGGRPLFLLGGVLVLLAGLALAAPAVMRRLAHGHTARAEALSAEKRYADSLAEADRAVALDADSAHAWALRGDAKNFLHDLPGSIADATRAIELDPKDPLAWWVRGMSRVASGDNRGAYDDLTRALEVTPGNPAIWANRGVVAHRLGDAKLGLADLTRAIEVDPSHTNAWFNRGLIRRLSGDREGALTDLERAVALEPGNGGYWTQRGIVLASLGRDDEAFSDYTKAIALDPRPVEALCQRALVFLRRGDWKAALADTAKALELDPRSVDALKISAGTHRRSEDWDALAREATRLIELAPKDAYNWSLRAIARGNRGDPDGAIEDGERAMALDPGCSGAWSGRGLGRMWKKELAPAIEDFSRAIELDPKDGWAWAWRGLARAQNKEGKGSLEDTEQAIKLLPRVPVLLYHRGFAYEVLGDVDRAIAAHESYLATRPPEELRAACEERLTKLRAVRAGR